MAAFAEKINKTELERFARFLSVGGIGTLLDFSLLTLLKTLGLPTILANTFSFSVGLINNFTWNRLWTFADAKKSDWRKQLAQFLMVSLVGLGINNLIVMTLEYPLGQLLGRPEYGYLPAKVLATGVVVFWNYFANRTWTFRNSEWDAAVRPDLRCRDGKSTEFTDDAVNRRNASVPSD